MSNWRKLFQDQNEDLKFSKRIKEIDVVLSELSTLKKDARVYCSEINSVFYEARPNQIKADMKKEKSLLNKKICNSDAIALSF